MKHIAKNAAPLSEQIKNFYPDMSASKIKKMIESGRVYLNGMSVNDIRTPTKPKDTIEVASRSMRLPDGVKILFEDLDLMVVYKPEGLQSVASERAPHHNLHSILKRYKPSRKITPLHRLDEGTSGILLFAFSDRAKYLLKEDFERKRIDRRYCAIVEGRLENKKDVWKNYLYETTSLAVKVGSEGNGQIAITHYERIAQNPRYAWIECRLETGRKNQIRVQAAHAGHPIVGDEKYGAFSDPIDRLCLHAYYLAFTHPITKKSMQFLVPPPARFFELVKVKSDRYLLSSQKELPMPFKAEEKERERVRDRVFKTPKSENEMERPLRSTSRGRFSRESRSSLLNKKTRYSGVNPRSEDPSQNRSEERNKRVIPARAPFRSDLKERIEKPRRKVSSGINRVPSWAPKAKSYQKHNRADE